MNCDDFQALILAGETSRELTDHVVGCETCRAAAPNLTAGAALLESDAMWMSPTDELEEGIVAMLVSDGAAGSDEAIPTLDDDLPPRLHAVDDPQPAGGERRTPNLWAGLGIAAVIVTGFLLFNNARSSPDWTVEAGAGPAAPNASAVIDGWNADGGTRLVVNASELEEAPEGFFYELWMSDGPLHISGGTFTGTSDIELWVAVPRSEFPRIWVTLEPIDEDESPSPEVVLDTDDPS